MVKRPYVTNITVTYDTRKKIKQLQLDLNLKLLDDVIQYLLRKEQTQKSTSSLEDQAEEVYFGQPPPSIPIPKEEVK